MANVNKVMLLGVITRQPEIKYTLKGTAVCELGLALNSIRKGDGGEKIEETTFVDVTLWGRTAEVAAEYAKKGSQIFVDGRLQMESWDDKETGKKRSKIKVTVENIQLLGGKPSGNSPSSHRKDEDDAPPDF